MSGEMKRRGKKGGGGVERVRRRWREDRGRGGEERGKGSWKKVMSGERESKERKERRGKEVRMGQEE